MDVLFGGMQSIGLLTHRLLAAASARKRWGWALGGALAACTLAAWMRGFTVDDALISVRYARNIARGYGWRFNADGPSTDGVTPLPWPLLLAAFARADALVVLQRAKVLGLVAWGSAGAALGWKAAESKAPWWAKIGAIAVLGLSVPPAAYAGSGMETSAATALATFAALAVRRPVLAGGIAGLAAAFRPEMAPWAVVLGVASGVRCRRPEIRAPLAAVGALLPFVACALVRLIVWGRPAPLALMAKPSDLAHGVAYAGAALVVTLTPVLALAPLSLRSSPPGTAVVLAGVAHVAAVIAVGGDWMPYARLMVPVVPSLAWAGILAAEQAHWSATAARTGAGIALGFALLPGAAGGRNVSRDREMLIAEARPVLRGAARIAALDVGWVAATTEADILDLGGLTDPEIAALPGGMTSKRVDVRMIASRGADALLLYAPHGLPDGGPAAWTTGRYDRVVEARLAGDESVAEHFAPIAWLPLGKGGAGYVVLRAAPRVTSR